MNKSDFGSPPVSSASIIAALGYTPEASVTVADATARLALTGLARGAMVYQTDTAFWYTLTNPAAPSSAGSWQGIPHVYRALLTQKETDAPVATVLENTLGGEVVWTYADAGEYLATLVGVFTENKTAVNISSLLGLVTGVRNDADSVAVKTFQAADDTQINGLLTATFIEILVYP